MQLNDLSSLLQLAVGANLGFGALASFYEPMSARTEKSLLALDDKLDEMVRNSEKNPDRTRQVFAVTKIYSELAQWFGILQFERRLWEGMTAKTVFMIFGAMSFIALLVVSLAADSQCRQSYVVLASIALLANIPPLIYAASMWFVAYRHHRNITPRLDRMEQQVFDFNRPKFTSGPAGD